MEKSFVFILKEEAKILTIKNSKQLDELPKNDGDVNKIVRHVWTTLDFEKLSKDYDAIEVFISNDFNLYFELYGWDCDSILIMNPNIIVEKRESK